MTTLVQSRTRPILVGAFAAALMESNGLVARIVPFSHLFRHAFEIEALNAAAIDPNPGYHPAVIAAHAMGGGLTSRIRLVLIHDPDGVLRAFVPLVMSRLAGGVLRLPAALDIPGVHNRMPIIDAGMPKAASALVEAIARFGGARMDGVASKTGTARVLVGATAALSGMRALMFNFGERPVLACRDQGEVAGGIDAEYRADLANAKHRLGERFGRLRLERLQAGARFAAAYETFRCAPEGAAGCTGYDRLAAAQEDENCLLIHRLVAGTTVLGMAMGLVAARRYVGIDTWIDRSLDAPAVPPVMAVKLSEALARDPKVDLATGGADVVTPAWRTEPTADLVIGAAMQAEAERALDRLSRLLRERRRAR